jgi:hypothetical protein
MFHNQSMAMTQHNWAIHEKDSTLPAVLHRHNVPADVTYEDILVALGDYYVNH